MLQAEMLKFIVIAGGLLIVAIVAAFVAQSSLQSGRVDAIEIAETALGYQAAVPPKALADITFTDADGAPLTLADKRGKVVVLNLWATWCPPCVREMPSLDRLETALGGPDLEVVALSVDRGGAAVVLPFLEKLGIGALGVYLDTSSRVLGALGINGLPTTILIDRDGREVGRVVGPAEWDSVPAMALIRHYMADPARLADAE